MKSVIVITVIILVLIQYIINKLYHVPKVPVLKEVCWGKESNCKEDDKSIRSFKINISNEILDDLHYRLKNAIIPEPIETVHQHYGFNGNTLKTIIYHWLNTYNWRQREVYLNQFSHYKTRIQGLDMHFIHVKPKVLTATPVYPIMICHGWPSSVREYYEVIPILSKIHEEYGFAFEVIVPSLPGFIFSEATTKPGLGAAQMALICKNLMKRIGHEKFYVHGTDWGSVVTKHMAIMYPDNVLGLHTNTGISERKLSLVKYVLGAISPSLFLSKYEADMLYPLNLKLYNFFIETGYYHIQATKPDTVGTAVANSPVGLAAYLLEKFSTLTDRQYKNRDDAGLLERFTYEKLLDNLMLYWVTRSITSASRIYLESNSKEHRGLNLREIPISPKVPCAVAKFPNEIVYLPNYILRDKYVNLIQTTDFEEGGHFAALENGLAEPFAEDIFSAVNKMLTLSEKEI